MFITNKLQQITISIFIIAIIFSPKTTFLHSLDSIQEKNKTAPEKISEGYDKKSDSDLNIKKKSEWLELPGPVVKLDMSQGGENILAVGLDVSGEAYKLKNDLSKWEMLPKKQGKLFKDISIGCDGFIGGVDTDDKVWFLEKNKWKLIVGSLREISIGSKNEIWGIDGNNIILRLKSDSSLAGSWFDASHKLGRTGAKMNVYDFKFHEHKDAVFDKNLLYDLWGLTHEKYQYTWYKRSSSARNRDDSFIKKEAKELGIPIPPRNYKFPVIRYRTDKRKVYKVESSDEIEIKTLVTRNKGTSVGAGADGTVLLADDDRLIYTFNRETCELQKWINSTELGTSVNMGSPKKIKVKDNYTIAFLDYQNQLWKRISGRTGKKTGDWQRVAKKHSVKDFAIGVNGDVIIVDKNNKIFLKKGISLSKKESIKQRGPIVHANQIVRITSSFNYNFKRLWTYTKSYYINNNAPNNHMCLLLNSPLEQTNDYRQDSGCFFALSHKDDTKSNDPIQYGDIVRIHSLFAIYDGNGSSSHEGPLSKERIWCVHEKETQRLPGLKYHDILVANIASKQTKNSYADFKIISPSSITGQVHKKDIVVFKSLAPHTKGKAIWIDSNSEKGAPFCEPMVLNLQGKGGTLHPSLGDRNLAGHQFFHLYPVNSEEDVPECKKRPDMITPKEVYGKIKGELFYAESELKVAEVEQDLSKGIGVLKEVRNFTGFPIKILAQGFKDDIKEDTYQFEPDFKLTKPITLEGFSKDTEIKNFGPSKMVSLKRLWSKGVAWITESLKTPGKTTIKFLARAQDQGGIQVFFNDKLEPSYKWRILIGGWNNTKAAIFKGKHIVAEVDGKISPLATTAPGRFVPYWVSINNGFIMVGVGLPGENVFMSCYIHDKNAKKINRVGFSSHDSPIDYTEIELSNHLVLKKDGEENTIKDNSLSISNKKEKIHWLKKNLRIPSEGGVYFETKTKYQCALAFENENEESYKIIFGAKGGQFLQILKKDKVVLENSIEKLPFNLLNKKIVSKLWVSFERNKIFVGQGKNFKNIIAIWEDQIPLKQVKKIGFISSGHEQKIANVKYIPPIIVTPFRVKSKYEKTVARLPYKGSLVLYNCLEWRFFQDGQAIAVKDMVTGKKFNSYATSEKGALYKLRVDLLKDGNPNIILLEKPQEAPEKIELQRQAALADIKADELKDNAEGLLRGAEAMSSFSGGGGAGEYIALAAGIGLTAGATYLHHKGASKAADAARKRLQMEMGYQCNDSEVYTELAQKAKGMYGYVPEIIQQNRDKVYTLLDEARDLSVFDDKDLGIILSSYMEILRLVNHQYILEEPSIKQRIIDKLSEIQSQINYLKNEELFSKAMSLFIMAFSNTLLHDKKDSVDKYYKQEWYLVLSDLSEHLFNKVLKFFDTEMEIKGLYGEYVWLPENYTLKNGKGSIVFEASGNNDALVCFAQDNFEAKDPDNKIYEIVFGAWDNEKVELRVRSLGRPAQETSGTTKKLKKGILHRKRFRFFWISIDNGTIKVGHGKIIGENILINWKDPFPWEDIKYIGFSSWNTPVTIQNIEFYEYIDKQKPAIKQKVDIPVDNQQDEVSEDTPPFDEESTAESKQTDQIDEDIKSLQEIKQLEQLIGIVGIEENTKIPLEDRRNAIKQEFLSFENFLEIQQKDDVPLLERGEKIEEEFKKLQNLLNIQIENDIPLKEKKTLLDEAISIKIKEKDLQENKINVGDNKEKIIVGVE
jgi:hypothetical protein